MKCALAWRLESGHQPNLKDPIFMLKKKVGLNPIGNGYSGRHKPPLPPRVIGFVLKTLMMSRV